MKVSIHTGFNRNAVNRGFTLLEMLITMVILSVILTVLITGQTGAIRLASRQHNEALQLTSMVEASGYVGDMVRQAAVIQQNMTVNGTTCSITSTTQPCFGVLVPASQGAASTAAFKLDTYLMLVYRLEPRSNLPAAYKITDAWADSNTYVLREYRSVVCKDGTSVPCGTTAPAAPTSVSNASWFLVADGISLKTPAGAAYSPFSTTTTTVGTTTVKKFTLRLQAVNWVTNKVLYTPSTGPQTVTLTMRN